MGKIKILAYCNPSYSRIVRIEQIFKYLNRTGDFTCVISPNAVNDQELLWADIIIAQGTVDPKMIADMWAYKVERNKVIIADRDDVVKVTENSPLKKTHDRLHAASWTDSLLKIASHVTTTNGYLKEQYEKLNKNVTVLPNMLDMEMWDRPRVLNETGMVRIGWTGSITHREDVRMVLPTLKEVLKEHPNAKFVFCGDPIFAKELKDVNPMQWEYVPATLDLYKWPMLAHTLSLDIGIAPLVDNDFNKGRSNLKFLEYSMLWAAGIYSPTAYQGTVKHGETGYIANTAEDWKIYLSKLTESKPTRDFISLNAKRYVESNYSIRDNIRKWGKFYRSTLQR